MKRKKKRCTSSYHPIVFCSSNTYPSVKIEINRSVKWQDIKESAKNLWIIMKDFLLTKSRLYSENSNSTSTSSTSGCTVKLHPSSSGTMTGTTTSPYQESTNTTFSDGSKTKRKGRRLSSTKFNCSCCGRNYPI